MSPASPTIIRNFFIHAWLSGLMAAVILTAPTAFAEEIKRPRMRDAGLIIGTLPPGPLNAITDVDGVRVGHTTVVSGDHIRTGVTAVLPHGGNVFQDRVPAAVHVGNGFGKLLGVTQVQELGELETPVLLTNTLSVWRAADALTTWMLEQPGMEHVRSINPVVGETNDGWLNDIRARAVTPEHVFQALNSAASGPVREGTVGAGTGTVAFGWKGGIGSSSRKLPEAEGGHTVGVLVQSNFGGDLTLGGLPLGRWLKTETANENHGVTPPREQNGSIMIVVATDAPLGARSLSRLASRALIGLSRTGSNLANGSGDYVIAFSTHPSMRRAAGVAVHELREVANEKQTPLFQAVAEATEEAIGNSLFAAVPSGQAHENIQSLPLDRVIPLIQKRKG